jgi:hypothetical protein
MFYFFFILFFQNINDYVLKILLFVNQNKLFLYKNDEV